LQEARYNKAAFKETGKDALDPKMACLVLYEGNNTFRVAAKEIQIKLHVFLKSMQGSWPNQYEIFLNATKAEQLRIKKMQALIPITQKCSDPNDPQLEAYSNRWNITTSSFGFALQSLHVQVTRGNTSTLPSPPEGQSMKIELQ
jgi:hypothetical protein